MTLSRLWLFLAVALPVLASLAATMSTVDLTYHLRAGREIVETGTIPTVDTWTFTVSGQPWFDQQWGAQALLRVAEALGSWTGLSILRAGATAIIVGSLLLIARRRGLDARTAALLVLAAFAVAAPAMALRPQLFGMACFAIVLMLVDGRRDHPRAAWLVPVVVMVWANLHGSFFLGPVVLGLAWLANLHDGTARPHRILLVAIAAAFAAGLTPFGPQVWLYAAGLSANPEVSARITEWQPTSLRQPVGLVFFASVAAVVALIARRGRPVAWPALAWLGTFVIVGLYAERGVAWWPLAAVPIVASLLVPTRSDRTAPDRPTLRRLNAALAATIVLVAVALLPVWRPPDPGTLTPAGLLTDAPSGITAALRELVRPGDRILNPQPWGSWFEYVFPEATVAVDSRIELIPGGVWNEYEVAVLGGSELLDHWGVTIIVVRPESRLVTAALTEAGWVRRYDDVDGVVLTSLDR